MTRWRSIINGLGRSAADVLWPPSCPISAERTSASGRLAPTAWGRVRFLAPPWCDHCGRPFEDAQPEGALCAACLRGAAWPPARAAIGYDDASRDMILAFKHADRSETARVFAQWMARAGGDFLRSSDVIVPTPLHWRRLLARRRNQAADLARALARRTGLNYRPECLVRRRATPSQGGLSAKARLRNVAGAFRAPARASDRLRGMRILLIDDVFTTGATLAACARTLIRAGAAEVKALTLARRL